MTRSLKLWVFVGMLFLGTSLPAQYFPFSLIADGDLNPATGGLVDNVAHPSLSPSGIIAFDGDDEGTTLDDWIWVGSGIVIVSGDAVTVGGAPSAFTVDNIDDFFEPGHVNDAGQVVWDGDIDGTPDTNTDEVLMRDLDVIMQEGTIYPAIDAVDDPGEWNSTCIDAAGTVYAEVDYDGGTTDDEVLVEIPVGGVPTIVMMNLFSEFREGATIVGGPLDAEVWDTTAFTDTNWNASGHMITDGNLDEVGTTTASNDVVLVRKLAGVDYELLAREGDAVTLPLSGLSQLITSFQDPQIATNGDWVSEADTDATTTEDNIVIGDVAGSGFIILVQEGQDVSAATGLAGTTLGFIDATAVNANGRVLILAQVEDDGVNIPPYDEALFQWEAGVLTMLATDEVSIPNRTDNLVDFEGDNISFNDLDQIWFEGDAGTLDGIFELAIPAIFPVENVTCAQATGTLTVDVTWGIPAGQVYDGYNIYVNGALETTINNGATTAYSTLPVPANSGVLVEVEAFAGVEIASAIGCNTFVTVPRDFTFCSTPNLTLLDQGVTTDTLDFLTDVNIQDLTVDLSIDHPDVDDFDGIIITSPFGTSVTLMDSSGPNAVNGVDVTIADFGAPAESLPYNVGAVMQPQGPGTMADFFCETSGGIWTLDISDQFTNDIGTLLEWCVNVYEETDPLVIADLCCPPPTDLTVANAGACGTGGIELAWTNNSSYGSLSLIKDDGVSPVSIALAATDTSYNDLATVDGTTYTYQLEYTCVAGGTVQAGPAGSALADSTFVPDVTDLVADVQVCNGQVILDWNTNGITYDSLEVFRAGSLLADVTGQSTYTDNAPLAGSASYSLVATCGVGAPAVVNLSVDFTLAGVSDLVCTVDTIACDGIATLTWTNNDAYTQIDVLIDGVAAATQPGPSDTSYLSDTLSSGDHTIEVVASCGANVAPSATCVVSVFVPPAGETDLILALEGRETAGAFDPGLVDSVTALRDALIANGVTPYITAPPVGSNPDFTTELPCGVDLTSFERIWVMTGTFPDDYRISAAEGDLLATLSSVDGVGIYFEGGDHWGFTHTASLLDERDGIELDTGTNVVDGDDTFTQTVGQDSGNGLNPTADFPAPVDYVQDQTGTDFTDQLSLSGTTAGQALDLDVATVGAMWLNSNDGIPSATDPDELLPYITGVYATNTVGGSMISHSFEFGGFGTAADREVLASLYLTALGAVITPGELFYRGDTNNDGGVNIADAVFLLGNLFPGPGGQTVIVCDDAADSNDDGTINIADAIALLGSLFGSPAVPLPAPNNPATGGTGCGVDPTDGDALDCAEFGDCP